ncbi:MAG: hypothetical protein U9R53_00030 [Chloroflexota bacterium]|nr:hypothetical protein [Chloroflexota bacterium]
MNQNIKMLAGHPDVLNKKGLDEEMKTRVERINPYLNVNDISQSMKYYVDVLGFDPYIELPNLGIVQHDGH